MIKVKLYKTKENEIYYYLLKSGEKRWMYRHKYKDIYGERKEKKKSSFKTENAAIRGLLEVKADLLNGHHNKVENDQITVSAWLEMWFETHQDEWKVSTVVQYRQIIDKIIKPRIGNQKLSKLNKTTYKRLFISNLLKTYKPSSVKRYHRAFMMTVNKAVEDELLLRNNLRGLKLEDDTKFTNVLSPAELNTFISLVKLQDNITSYTMILLLSYTGLRQGEMFGLKWKDIDFNEKTITVERTRDNHGVRTPKTKNSYRTIGVDDLLITQIKLYQKWCLETKFRYGEQLDKKDDYVFISSYGGHPASYIILHHAFKLIYEHCKKEDITLNRITPHGLRHSHASVLVNDGIPPKEVADRLGNSVEMIMKTYAHSSDEVKQRAIDSFSNSLSGAKSGAN